jgi:hypothetical protein
MTKVEFAKSNDGREIILRLKGVGQVLERPSVRISWIGTSKTLGTKGWENLGGAIRPDIRRDGADLLLILEIKLTNHIAPGTPVRISIPDLDISEELNWRPERFPGVTGKRSDEGVVDVGGGLRTDDHAGHTETEGAGDHADDAEAADSGDQPQEADTGGEVAKLKKLLTEKELEITRLRKGAGILGLPLRSVVPLAIVLSLAIGASAEYVWFKQTDINPNSVRRLNETIRNLRKDIAKLQTEAFAPLNSDIVTVTPLSPKGESPLPKLPGRAREFYNKGVTNMKAGNRVEALYWYKQAIGLCERESLTYIGDAYFNGDGAPPDPRTGFQLMRCASALGSDPAREYLKELLHNGRIPLAPPTFGDQYNTSGGENR